MIIHIFYFLLLYPKSQKLNSKCKVGVNPLLTGKLFKITRQKALDK